MNHFILFYKKSRDVYEIHGRMIEWKERYNNLESWTQTKLWNKTWEKMFSFLVSTMLQNNNWEIVPMRLFFFIRFPWIPFWYCTKKRNKRDEKRKSIFFSMLQKQGDIVPMWLLFIRFPLIPLKLVYFNKKRHLLNQQTYKKTGHFIIGIIIYLKMCFICDLFYY